MSKATIIIEDIADDKINIKIEFDPPIGNNDDRASPAQYMAAGCLEFLSKQIAADRGETQ